MDLEASGAMAQDPQITLQENYQEIKLFNLFFFVVVVLVFVFFLY